MNHASNAWFSLYNNTAVIDCGIFRPQIPICQYSITDSSATIMMILMIHTELMALERPVSKGEWVWYSKEKEGSLWKDN